MQVTADLAGRISHNALAIDGLNRDLSEGNAALDHRVSRYLNEMERRARERLQKYHYYLAKAYQYRLLRPYQGDLNLANMFDLMQAIVDAGSDEYLSSADFESLKAIYEDQLAVIAEEVLDLYNANPPELSVQRSFTLSAEQRDALNAGEPVVLNLADMGLTLPDEENVRIVELAVTPSDIDVHPEDGACDVFAFLDLWAEYSGDSSLRWKGNTYNFAHYTEATASPIGWGVTYDECLGEVSLVTPSAASESLLRALVELSDAEALIYSRPALDAQLSITKTVSSNNGIDLVVDRLRFRVRYDFMRQPSGYAGLEVRVSEDNLLPYFIVSKMDENGRQDGRGSFFRYYARNETVIVEAPTTDGIWEFEKWTDRFGNDLPGGPHVDPALELLLSDDQVVVARFVVVCVPHHVPTFVNCMNGPFGETGPGCTCVDTDGDSDVDLVDFAEFQIEFTGP